MSRQDRAWLVTWRVLFAVAVAGQLVVLYWPRPVSAGGLPYLDKAVHFAVFAAVTSSGLRSRVLPARWLIGVLAVHAVVSEVLQASVLPARSGDPWDVVADLAGVAAGALAATVLARASWRREHVTHA